MFIFIYRYRNWNECLKEIAVDLKLTFSFLSLMYFNIIILCLHFFSLCFPNNFQSNFSFLYL